MSIRLNSFTACYFSLSNRLDAIDANRASRESCDELQKTVCPPLFILRRDALIAGDDSRFNDLLVRAAKLYQKIADIFNKKWNHEKIVTPLYDGLEREPNRGWILFPNHLTLKNIKAPPFKQKPPVQNPKEIAVLEKFIEVADDLNSAPERCQAVLQILALRDQDNWNEFTAARLNAYLIYLSLSFKIEDLGGTLLITKNLKIKFKPLYPLIDVPLSLDLISPPQQENPFETTEEYLRLFKLMTEVYSLEADRKLFCAHIENMVQIMNLENDLCGQVTHPFAHQVDMCANQIGRRLTVPELTSTYVIDPSFATAIS